MTAHASTQCRAQTQSVRTCTQDRVRAQSERTHVKPPLVVVAISGLADASHALQVLETPDLPHHAIVTAFFRLIHLHRGSRATLQTASKNPVGARVLIVATTHLQNTKPGFTGPIAGYLRHHGPPAPRWRGRWPHTAPSSQPRPSKTTHCLISKHRHPSSIPPRSRPISFTHPIGGLGSSLLASTSRRHPHCCKTPPRVGIAGPPHKFAHKPQRPQY